MAKVLTSRDYIREWTTARGGNPCGWMGRMETVAAPFLNARSGHNRKAG